MYNISLYPLACEYVHAWFLKIDPMQIVGMRVCLHPRLLITSGVMWRDIDLM